MRSGARVQAAETVDRILRRGAYSNVVVATTHVSPESDHAFFQRLVYTVLRHRPFIDGQIAAASSRDLASLSPSVVSVLRVAVAELCVLGTADHAAVNEAVDAIRLLGPAKAAPFVNAVLRSVATSHPVPSNDPADAFPPDVVAIAERAFGPAASVFLQASNEPASIGLRFRSEPVGTWARYASGDEDVEALVRAGVVSVMDPASARVVEALDPQPHDRIVDLAAAPGGKTLAMADATAGRASIIGMDRNWRRVRDAAKRLRSEDAVRWMVGDASHPPLEDGSFDRVLLDAPCTGLGTLRRRPEIRYRVDDAAPTRYRAMQRSMIESAIPLLAPGGRLVYSVCTISPEETVDAVEGFGFRPPDDTDGERAGDGILLAPHTTATDGMFIAVLDR